MVRGLVRLGLLISAIAVLALIVVETELGGDHRTFLRKAILVGAGTCAVGLVLGLLLKVTNLRVGRRCPRCRRPVRPGHIYCEDHFQESLNRGRDRLARR